MRGPDERCAATSRVAEEPRVDVCDRLRDEAQKECVNKRGDTTAAVLRPGEERVSKAGQAREQSETSA